MKPYLLLQYPYEYIQIALCSKGKIKECIQESKLTAVQYTIPYIEQLLTNHEIGIKDLSFIAINTGPGPYNTLRALISTVNGIHFVQKTPLVTGCALNLLLQEYPGQPSLVILNAFAQHVFYAFNTKDSTEQGYCSVEQLICKINSQPQQLVMLGNGATLYQKQLLQDAKDKIIFYEKTPAFNSLEIFAKKAFADYKAHKIAASFLLPRYLQSPTISKKI